MIQQIIDEYKFHHWYAKNSDKTLEELFDEGAESLRNLTKDFVLSPIQIVEKILEEQPQPNIKQQTHLKIFREENV
jgi:hypothetical protein